MAAPKKSAKGTGAAVKKPAASAATPAPEERDLPREAKQRLVAVWVTREEFAHSNPSDTVDIRVTARDPSDPPKFTDDAAYVLSDATMDHPDIVRACAVPLMRIGPVAIVETLGELLTIAEPADLQTNSLSWLGNRVSYHLRREVLLQTLDAVGWNLTRAAERLHTASSGSVVRLIRDLGLSGEYAAARKAGAGKRGRPPSKP